MRRLITEKVSNQIFNYPILNKHILLSMEMINLLIFKIPRSKEFHLGVLLAKKLH